MLWKKNGQRWPTKLVQLIRASDWAKVRRRLRSHPFEASIRDPNDLGSPLNEAICCDPLPPVDIIELLVQVDVNAVSEHYGRAEICPLHVLLAQPDATQERRRREIIKALLCADVHAASIRDKWGRTPLVVAFEQRAMDFAEIEIAALTIARQSPKDWSMVGTKRARQLIVGGGLYSWWNDLLILLGAEYKGEVFDTGWGAASETGVEQFSNQHFGVLHACAAVEACPIQLLRFAALVYPEECRTPNEDMNIPLHLALKCRSDKQYSSFVGTELSNAVDALLRACPNSASILDGSGRLPISLAIEAGVHWDHFGGALKKLFESEPRALSTRDVTSHMYPFMMCAISSKMVLGGQNRTLMKVSDERVNMGNSIYNTASM
eukprot:CAMPEP_0113537392 /NCGR_PEP_ID=MMETSP0015_2-20120614/6800_1 /TAXON_ID=2838 /ORGANISM="Odontella" /LENGTH=377 /DNA_ID=CAMNT_0000436881 /DNA_START=42 /DNA_END=1172 /DNA_ORIENTATION=+ /assembly_acc=CAM_ASM_000160